MSSSSRSAVKNTIVRAADEIVRRSIVSAIVSAEQVTDVTVVAYIGNPYIVCQISRVFKLLVTAAPTRGIRSCVEYPEVTRSRVLTKRVVLS